MKSFGLFIQSTFVEQWRVPGPGLVVGSGYPGEETGPNTAREGLRGEWGIR